MSSDATYRKEPAMSKASVKEVVVGTAGTGSAVVVELPFRWPAELKPGNEALKSARSSSGGFCELLLGEKLSIIVQLVAYLSLACAFALGEMYRKRDLPIPKH